MTRARTMLRSVAMAGCVAAALALGGCDDMMARRDGISPDAGNAVAANAALQIIDPWPSPAFDPRAASDGTRLASAMERYRSGGPIAPPDNAGKTTPVVFSPVSTGAQ